MSIIKVDNLIFDYPQEADRPPVRAIDGVSFDIEEGSFTAILGRNGSGKSTLARCLNGLLLPTEGAVYVGGIDTRDEERIMEVHQTAGMVFQNPDNQLVSSIVEDDVAFGPENLGIEPSEIRKRVDEALENVRTGNYKDKAPHQLSGGQKQRVAIAGVVAMRPRCIIFDEPTAMLDPKGKKEIMDVVEELHDQGTTIVLITHFMEEAARADRVIIMEAGKVSMDGSPVEVFSRRDRLLKLDMDLPAGAEIAGRLRNRGIQVPADIIDKESLAEYIITQVK